MAALQWQALHRKAVARCEQQEVRHDRLVRELKAQALKSNAALQSKLDFALAQVRDLQKRLFSTKSEQGRPCESRSRAQRVVNADSSAARSAMVVPLNPN